MPQFSPQLLQSLDAVRAGATLAVGKAAPVHALLALLSAGRRGIHLVGVPTSGFGPDLLAAGGALDRIETGALIIAGHGMPPNLLRRIEAGEIAQIESSCPLIELQLVAGASGIDFVHVPGLAGSDLLKRRPDIRSIPHPYETGTDVFVAPAMRPDVAMIHGLRADRDGNVVVSIQNEERLLARAARHVIATVEEVVDEPLTGIADDQEVIPAMCIDALAVARLGAWPLALPGAYGEDRPAIGAWLAASTDDASIARHMTGLRPPRPEGAHG